MTSDLFEDGRVGQGGSKERYVISGRHRHLAVKTHRLVHSGITLNPSIKLSNLIYMVSLCETAKGSDQQGNQHNMKEKEFKLRVSTQMHDR